MSDPAKRSIPLIAFILLALLAVGDGVYLTLAHIDYETGNRGVATVCHTLTEHGCSVTAGRFGALLGIPVATIGFAGGVAILVLGVMAFMRRDKAEDPARSLMLLLAGFSVFASLMMMTFSFIEGSFCPFCIAWYFINFGLLVTAYLARNRDYRMTDTLDDVLGTYGFVALGVFTAALIFGVFWHNTRRDRIAGEQKQEMLDQAPEIGAALARKIVENDPKPGLELPGSPKKGPDDAEVRIVEFGDFECPHCRKLWDSVEQYASTTDRKVQVVFANYPLHESCNPAAGPMHKSACRAAVAGVCAERQGKFWEYGQKMFDNQRNLSDDDLKAYADDVGLDRAEFDACLTDPKAMGRVKVDIGMGIKLDIKATPTWYINGYAKEGGLPPELMPHVVDGILDHQANNES